MGVSAGFEKLKRLMTGTQAAASLPARQPRRKPRIGTDADCTYAIGDIHGCIEKLRRLEQAIVTDAAEITGSKLLVYLGDYIDRGPGSAAVIEHLLAPPPPGFHRICLCGNHEEVLIDVVDGRRSLDEWLLRFGGENTLLSYGFDLAYMAKHREGRGAATAQHAIEAIPERHLAFLRQLPSAFATPSYFFAHAGIRPGVPMSEQRDEDLLWIRNSFLAGDAAAFECPVIHGHTPNRTPMMADQRIGVDTGAYMGGPLTAVRLTSGAVRFLDDR